MTLQELSMQLFQLQTEAENIAKIISSIHEAMENNAYTSGAYNPAMWLIGNMIEEHAGKIQDLTDLIDLKKNKSETLI